MIEKQRAERKRLKTKLDERRDLEAKQRQERFRIGLKGLWDRVRGEHRKITQTNEREAWAGHLRDQKQTDEFIFRQMDKRKVLKREQRLDISAVKDQAQELAKDSERFRETRGPEMNR